LPDAERLPCFATLTPQAAVTKATAVEMLKVEAPSPPVPQVSTSGIVTSSRKVGLIDWEYKTSTIPSSSSADTPLL
jgi:hypothetical protein